MLTRERRREAGEPQLSHFSSSTGCLFFHFFARCALEPPVETCWRRFNGAEIRVLVLAEGNSLAGKFALEEGDCSASFETIYTLTYLAGFF